MKKATRFARHLVALLFAAMVVSCGYAGHMEQTWTEDVQLDDGKSVVIERHTELDLTEAWGGGAGNVVETRSVLRIREQRLPDWDYPLRPLLLYRDPASAEWVIVATTNSCQLAWARGNPPGRYFEFRSAGGWWKPVELSARSQGHATNLLYQLADGKLPEHVTLEEKRARQSSIGEPEFFQTINIEAGSEGCGPVAPNQG